MGSQETLTYYMKCGILYKIEQQKLHTFKIKNIYDPGFDGVKENLDNWAN